MHKFGKNVYRCNKQGWFSDDIISSLRLFISDKSVCRKILSLDLSVSGPNSRAAVNRTLARTFYLIFINVRIYFKAQKVEWHYPYGYLIWVSGTWPGPQVCAGCCWRYAPRALLPITNGQDDARENNRSRGAGEGFTCVFGSVSEGFVCFDIYSSSTWCAITSPRSKQAASKTTRTYTSVCRPTVGSEVWEEKNGLLFVVCCLLFVVCCLGWWYVWVDVYAEGCERGIKCRVATLISI